MLLHRSAQASWMEYAPVDLAPVVMPLQEMVLTYGRTFADETVPVRDPWHGQPGPRRTRDGTSARPRAARIEIGVLRFAFA